MPAGVSRTKTSAVLPTKSKLAIQIKAAEQEQHPLSPEELSHLRTKDSWSFSFAFILIQIGLAVIYGIWIVYPGTSSNATRYSDPQTNLTLYPYFRDVNVMIFFGFGFLMTFLRRYGYSAVGYTLLISALVAEWSVPIEGFFERIYAYPISWESYEVSILQLINGLFCAGAVMISYGAILGKVTPSQMLIMGMVEPLFYWVNIYVTIDVLQAVDVGGGMTIHTFGAYFGLAVTWWLTSPITHSHKDNCSNYSSDLFSLAGTLFLWIMWPSFNAATGKSELGQVRALVNTFLSLCSCTFSAFIFSRLFSGNKFDIVHIQNSTLAGGVVMGVSADMIVTPVGAIICGFCVGIISVLGYRFVTPILSNKLGIQDICGVHNLHGMPGVSSCIVGIFACLGATVTSYNSEYDIFIPLKNSNQQAGIQTASLFITLGIAIFGGTITGILMKKGWAMGGIIKSDFFNDRTFWNLPSDYDFVIDKEEEPAGPREIEMQETKREVLAENRGRSDSHSSESRSRSKSRSRSPSPNRSRSVSEVSAQSDDKAKKRSDSEVSKSD